MLRCDAIGVDRPDRRKEPLSDHAVDSSFLRTERRSRKRFEIHRIGCFPNGHQLAIRLLCLEERGFLDKRVHSEAAPLYVRLSRFTKHAIDRDVQ